MTTCTMNQGYGLEVESGGIIVDCIRDFIDDNRSVTYMATELDLSETQVSGRLGLQRGKDSDNEPHGPEQAR
jgi:hypothetical protein